MHHFPKDFVSPSCVARHKEKVHKELVATCHICQDTLPSSAALAEHKSQAHGVAPKPTGRTKRKVNRNRYPCTVCQKVFFSASRLADHDKRFHEPDGESAVAAAKRFQCEQCHKVLSSNDSLQKHISQIHDGVRYPCDECGRILSSLKCLKLHKRIVHEGIKFTCDECGKQFVLKIQLTRHKRNVHSDDPIDETEVCDKCGWKARNKRAMHQHRRKADFVLLKQKVFVIL